MKRHKKKKKQKPEENPEDLKLFDELCSEVATFGIETRVEKGNFHGGICVMEDESRVLFVNRKHTLDRRIALVYRELALLKEDSPNKDIPETSQSV